MYEYREIEMDRCKITRTPRPSDYFLSFGLWSIKSSTSSEDIVTILVPKERSDLVLHSVLNKFGQNSDKI